MPTLAESTKSVMEQSAMLASALSSIVVRTQPNCLVSSLSPYAQITSRYVFTSPLQVDQSASIAIWENRESKIRASEIQKEFNELAKQWRSERGAVSSTTALSMHPAYQLIIGMGERVLPFIFADLQKQLDHWFWALRAITHADPVSPENRGNMEAMATAWLNWGREKGYAPR